MADDDFEIADFDTLDPQTSFLRGIYMQQLALVSTLRQTTEAGERQAKALEEMSISMRDIATALNALAEVTPNPFSAKNVTTLRSNETN